MSCMLLIYQNFGIEQRHPKIVAEPLQIPI
jgi:hypothetical protein